MTEPGLDARLTRYSMASEVGPGRTAGERLSPALAVVEERGEHDRGAVLGQVDEPTPWSHESVRNVFRTLAKPEKVDIGLQARYCPLNISTASKAITDASTTTLAIVRTPLRSIRRSRSK